MLFTPHHQVIIAFNALTVLVFAVLFLSRRSYEFVSYIVVIGIYLALVLASLPKVKYTLGLLWGLSLWSLLHMAGGGVTVAGQKLYATLLLPLNSEVLRYDQVVHAFGFFVATLLVYELVKFSYPGAIRNRLAVGIVVVMAGLGFGALNEIFEFLVTLVVPDTSIGGYVNTSLDLVADLLGALLAWTVVLAKERQSVLG
jgi:putative membrane protein